MFLECARILEDPEETHTDMMRTIFALLSGTAQTSHSNKRHQSLSWVYPGIKHKSSCCEATMITTQPLCHPEFTKNMSD